MYAWRTEYDHEREVRVHRAAAGVPHALFAPLLTNAFSVLKVSASVWEHGPEWWPLHFEPNPLSFELEHGRDLGRSAYNIRHFGQARRTQKIVRGEFGGYSDLFAPVVIQGRVVAFIAVGPFATSPPNSDEIMERWRVMTGRRGHHSDPEFSAYVSTALRILVLEGQQLDDFQNLVGCLTALMAGDGHPDQLMNKAELLRFKLESTRLPERMWGMTATMLDERSPRTGYAPAHTHQLKRLGVSRIADHLLVGLTRSRRAKPDPVDEMVSRYLFQRCSVETARTLGDVLCGQVGDHGVVFLCGSGASDQRKKRKVQELASHLNELGRKLDLSIYFGASRDLSPAGKGYQSALDAARSAMSRSATSVVFDTDQELTLPVLRELRQELDRTVLERPDLVRAQFNRYLEAVALQAGYRMEAARTQLEVGFERMAQVLVDSSALEPKSLSTMSRTLEFSANRALTLNELFASYRTAVGDLADAVQSPVASGQGRGLQRAIGYIDQHYTEDLPAEQVAREAGFSPKYFSRLFKQHAGMTFEHYVQKLRLERAKLLLTSTGLDVERVARLSGFNSSQYFCRVFQRLTRFSPGTFRKRRGKVAAIKSKTK